MKMIGIYIIKNKINGHSYIGQSIDVCKRWQNHIIASNNKNDKGYDYPLYRAIRKYGIKNFSFEVVEECLKEQLNEKEIFWIAKLKPEYNQTLGGETGGNVKLTLLQVQEIQNLLISDSQGKIQHTELAKKYKVHKDTIRDINVGRTWYNKELNYPLHKSILAHKFYCIDCGKQISKGSLRCNSCEGKHRKQENILPISREQLKKLIRQDSFVSIGQKFGVSDNAIKKWCIKYNLPSKKKDIKQYSDIEWSKI